jgi:hypothetical protein
VHCVQKGESVTEERDSDRKIRVAMTERRDNYKLEILCTVCRRERQ